MGGNWTTWRKPMAFNRVPVDELFPRTIKFAISIKISTFDLSGGRPLLRQLSHQSPQNHSNWNWKKFQPELHVQCNWWEPGTFFCTHTCETVLLLHSNLIWFLYIPTCNYICGINWWHLYNYFMSSNEGTTLSLLLK